MAIRTITEPTAEQQLLDTYNRKMKASNVKVLEPGRKYAVCLVSLAGAVSQPDDYAALKAAVMVEDVAKTVLLASLLGNPDIIPPEEVARAHKRYMEKYGQ